jgi:hypothetical protein
MSILLKFAVLTLDWALRHLVTAGCCTWAGRDGLPSFLHHRAEQVPMNCGGSRKVGVETHGGRFASCSLGGISSKAADIKTSHPQHCQVVLPNYKKLEFGIYSVKQVLKIQPKQRASKRSKVP